MKTILVTGGAGYIGSHAVIELLQSGCDITVVDSLVNSSQESLKRVEKITGKAVDFIRADIRDGEALAAIFADKKFDAVIHFAGLKAVGESVANPALYYDNNVMGSLTLFEEMRKADIFNIVFSSSATVYGEPSEVPIPETHPTGTPASPYGKSKLIIEQILQDYFVSDGRWSIALLRYFNPVGAHHSGLVGEAPRGIPNNLVPYISQVATGKLDHLQVFGDDYPTADGTGVRDYIHVVDLAKGHLSALRHILGTVGCHTWNLGTGTGCSVLELVDAFEKISGIAVPYRISPRRAGDIAEYWSSPEKAKTELGWEACLTLDEMMADAWAWQKNNPNGYAEASD